MFTKNKKLVFSMVFAVCMILVLAACGSNSTSSSASPPAEETAKTESGNGAATEVVDVRLDVVSSGTQSIPAFVMQKLELDEKYGFNLSIHENSGAGGANWTAVKTGEVDAIITNWLDIARNRSQTTPVYAVAPFLGWSNGLLVSKDSKIAAAGDLKDLKLGVYNTKSLDWVLIRAAAEKAGGFDPGTENEVTEGAPGLLAGLLEQKKVDAILNYGDMNTKFEGTGNYKVAFTVADVLKELGMNAEAPFLYYGFTEEFINENPETVTAFVSAYKEAVEYLRSDNDIWSEIAKEKFDITDDAGISVLKGTLREAIKLELDDNTDSDARELFQWLADNGNTELLGVEELPDKLFWTGQ